jgi:hypothetical protein
LPAKAPEKLEKAYRNLAQTWKAGAPGWEIELDRDRTQLPDKPAVWLLGWNNRFLDDLAATQTSLSLDRERRLLRLPEGDYPGREFSFALAVQHGDRLLGWAASNDPAAVAGLARKLPHYGKYSYLAFQGLEPTNRLKSQWPVKESKLMVWLTDQRPALTLPPRDPLSEALRRGGP